MFGLGNLGAGFGRLGAGRGGAGAFRPIDDTVVLIPFFGQSGNVFSVGGQTASVVSGSYPKARMFNGGVRAHLDTPGLGNENHNVNCSRMLTLTRLQEALNPNDEPWGEGKSTGWARNDESRSYMFVSAARGAMSIANLELGQTHFTNLVLSVLFAYRSITESGWDFELGPLAIDQGEANTSLTDQATYVSQFTAWRTNILNYIGTALGVVIPADHPTIIKQNANHSQSFGRDVALAQLQLAVDNPTFIFIRPDYPYMTSADPLHSSSADYLRKGRKEGEICREVLDGNGFPPFRVSSALRSGTTVTATISGIPRGSAVINTTTLTDPGQYGFTYTNTVGGANNVLSGFSLSATVANTATMTMTLASGVAGTLRAGMHTTTNLPTNRTNICDSDPDDSGPNWMCSSSVAVA
jgi:hypothetical protein